MKNWAVRGSLGRAGTVGYPPARNLAEVRVAESRTVSSRASWRGASPRESLATGTDFLTELVATAQPASSAGTSLAGSSTACSKAHISHSRSAALLRNVQRGHSHSSRGAEAGCGVILEEISGFRDMLVDEAWTARVGGGL
eukprot:scaffold23527_cov61-Phaeocystis_antarctica.AAC.5